MAVHYGHLVGVRKRTLGLGPHVIVNYVSSYVIAGSARMEGRIGMWKLFLRSMRFGPYSHLLDGADSRRAPLCAISGWAVAHGGDSECFQVASPTDLVTDDSVRMS